MIHNGGRGDSLDHIQNRILSIHDPKRFFTTDKEITLDDESQLVPVVLLQRALA